MKYIKSFNKIIIEQEQYNDTYVKTINNHIRHNNIEFFKNNDILPYKNEYIIIATMYGYTEIVKYLVEIFDVNQTNNINRTAAYYTRKKPEILKILLENGLDIEHEDDYDEIFFKYIDIETLEKIKNIEIITKYLKSQKQKKFNL